LGGIQIYPFHFFNGVRSEAVEKSGAVQREFSRELSQGIYTKPAPMDEAYISFKKIGK
jgi:hypothetical protein